MKKTFSHLIFMILILSLHAQAPQKMSYQCVIRNSSGALETNQSVGIRISILQGTTTGTVVYQETYNPNPQTNTNGLVSIEIGGGLAITGTFTGIDWATGPYFLKTETDPTGSTNYTIVGISQLLSVPYAMYAKTAGNEFSGSYNDLTNKPILFSGNYNDLTNKPTLFNGTWANLTGKPTTIAGYGIIDGVTTSGNQTIADNKTFSGTTTVPTPVNATDAATKAYVDAILDKLLQTQAELGAKDIDGNTYKAVKIGTQVWMAENLKTTKYNDNSLIPLVTDNTQWGTLSTPGYCWYNNDAATYKSSYGALYNWYAVDAGSNGGRNICPVGWHVPTDEEFKLLELYLGMNQAVIDLYGFRGTDQGSQMKHTFGWYNSGNGTNSSGFSALPAGGRNAYYGLFGGIDYIEIFLSTSEYDTINGWDREVEYNYDNVRRDGYSKKGGAAIRCLKN
ncbi:MAG: fibrobacter succinogenes major paralogous domain-containing protein [Bacteroidales bacterium]